MAKRVVPGSLTKAYQNKDRDFAPNLVGQQFTDPNSFFTLGNFSLTTNNSNITGEFFNTGEFSQKFTLDTLEITTEQSVKINNKTSNRLDIRLKSSKNDLLSYVYFSDASKFVESEIIGVIEKWKGSLFVRFSYVNDTVTDFSYDEDKNISYFTVSKNVITNFFELVTNEETEFQTNNVNDISYLPSNFTNYEISNDFGKFPIIAYTGNTLSDDYIKIKTTGIVWPTLLESGSSNGSFQYHVKPNDNVLEDVFYGELTPFQTQLMTRDSIPIYTINLKNTSEAKLGFSIESFNTFTWPLEDGYNISIQGRDYADYLLGMISFAESFDSKRTNIMSRKLVAGAIFEFDTAGDGNDPTSGRKMNKLIKIWGREYDKVKTYIDGISFANVVTYDENENTPDELIKMMARTLGFDTLQSYSSEKLLEFFRVTNQSEFPSNTRGTSFKDMDIELWRRLIINAWWLFKSKGTRKVIEFFLNLFRIDECLVDLDEIVYVVDQKLDYQEIITELTSYYGFQPNESQLRIDTDGYPKILPNSPEYYFQLNGFWYDGGVPENTKPDVKGNNPHFGPYDYGRAYFDKYRCLLENFEPQNIVANLNLLTFNYFTDYSLGTIEGVGQTTIDITNEGVDQINNGSTLVEYDNSSTNPFYANIMNDVDNVRVLNAQVINAGRDDETSSNGESSFHINIFTGGEEFCENDFCPQNIYPEPNNSGIFVYSTGQPSPAPPYLPLENEFCCGQVNGINYYNDSDGTTPCYLCPPVDFEITQLNSNGDEIVIGFTKPDGSTKLIDKTCCDLRYGVNNWVVPLMTIPSPNGGVTTIEGIPFCLKPSTTLDPIEDVELG
jgi:hypothetical protein